VRTWACPFRLRSFEKYGFVYDGKSQQEFYTASYKGFDAAAGRNYDGETKVEYIPTRPLYDADYVFFHDSVSEYTAFSRSISKEDRETVLGFLKLMEPGIEDFALSQSPSGFTHNGIPLESKVKVLPFVRHEQYNIVPLYMFGDIINRAAFILLKICSTKRGGVLLIDDMDMLYNLKDLHAFTQAMLDLIVRHGIQVFMTSYNEPFFENMFRLIGQNTHDFKDARLYRMSKSDAGVKINMQPTEVVVFKSINKGDSFYG
jgi:AAA15 family ATPase/GTPase